MKLMRENELTAFRGTLIFGLEPTRSRCFFTINYSRSDAGTRSGGWWKGGGADAEARTEERPNSVKESRGMKRAGRSRKGRNIISITKRRDVR